MNPLSSLPTTIAAIAIAASGFSLSTAHGQDWGYNEDGAGAESSSRRLFKNKSIFAYDYLDLGYFNYDFDDAGVDSATGFGGELSLPITSTLFAKASLSYATPETSDGEDLDYLAWKLGGGIGIPMKSNLDLVIEGGLAREKFASGILDNPIDGHGLYVAPSLRLMLGDLFEIDGGVTITNIDNNTNFGLDLKALMHITPRLSAFGSAYYSNEVSQYGLGLRLSF
ncbi:porin family protein [Verrucomicrobiales bacterium]|nr:porin family protein [Verrucomicrobiales bacterium]